MLRLEQRAWGFGGMAKIAAGFDEQRQCGAGREERVEHRGKPAAHWASCHCEHFGFPLGKGKMWEAFGQGVER